MDDGWYLNIKIIKSPSHTREKYTFSLCWIDDEWFLYTKIIKSPYRTGKMLIFVMLIDDRWYLNTNLLLVQGKNVYFHYVIGALLWP